MTSLSIIPICLHAWNKSKTSLQKVGKAKVFPRRSSICDHEAESLYTKIFVKFCKGVNFRCCIYVNIILNKAVSTNEK